MVTTFSWQVIYLKEAIAVKVAADIALTDSKQIPKKLQKTKNLSLRSPSNFLNI